MIDIIELMLLVIVTEATTEIIVDSKIFSEIRFRIRKKAFPEQPGSSNPIFVFVAELISCGYCTSVWVAMWWSLFAPSFFKFGFIINWVIMGMVIHRLSNWLHVVYSLVKKGRIKTYDIELKLIHTNEAYDGSVGYSVSAGENQN